MFTLLFAHDPIFLLRSFLHSQVITTVIIIGHANKTVLEAILASARCAIFTAVCQSASVDSRLDLQKYCFFTGFCFMFT